jgi:PD-(D/E)XK nuclease superfamily
MAHREDAKSAKGRSNESDEGRDPAGCRASGGRHAENKSVQEAPRIYEAQLLTYLTLSGDRLGFLVNWNVALITDGIKRMVNGL